MTTFLFRRSAAGIPVGTTTNTDRSRHANVREHDELSTTTTNSSAPLDSMSVLCAGMCSDRVRESDRSGRNLGRWVRVEANPCVLCPRRAIRLDVAPGCASRRGSLVCLEMDQPLAENFQSTPRRSRARYVQQIHVEFVVVLAAICVAVGVVGWELHPKSSGFRPVPQDLRIVVSESNFDVTETLMPTSDGGATLTITRSQTVGNVVRIEDSSLLTVRSGPDPVVETRLRDPFFTLSTGKGAATPLSAIGGLSFGNPRHWLFIVMDPGSAQPCDSKTTLHETEFKRGRVRLNLPGSTGPGTPSLVVSASTRPTPLSGSEPPLLCLHWSSNGPVSVSGPNLAARFPQLQGLSADGVAFSAGSGIPGVSAENADVADGTTTRTLQLTGGHTADWNIQTDPHPTRSTSRSWTWETHDSPQVIEMAAINSSDTQRETKNAFLSGILFGIAGAALITLIAELVAPLNRRRDIKIGP
jgi:hypothetical protein